MRAKSPKPIKWSKGPGKGFRPFIVPHEDSRIDRFDGWGLYQTPQPPSTSPLWVQVKAVHVARADEKRGPTSGRRSYWLFYGVDERRFRRDRDSRHFAERFPAVFERFEATCRDDWFTVKQVEHQMRFQGIDPAKERARLAASTVKRAEHRAGRIERAHELALEEDRQRMSAKSVSERQE